jgi:hypothetical protein
MSVINNVQHLDLFSGTEDIIYDEPMTETWQKVPDPVQSGHQMMKTIPCHYVLSGK